MYVLNSGLIGVVSLW